MGNNQPENYKTPHAKNHHPLYKKSIFIYIIVALLGLFIGTWFGTLMSNTITPTDCNGVTADSKYYDTVSFATIHNLSFFYRDASHFATPGPSASDYSFATEHQESFFELNDSLIAGIHDAYYNLKEYTKSEKAPMISARFYFGKTNSSSDFYLMMVPIDSTRKEIANYTSKDGLTHSTLIKFKGHLPCPRMCDMDMSKYLVLPGQIQGAAGR